MVLEGDIQISRCIFLPYKNFLSQFVWVQHIQYPALWLFQKSWYPVISLDGPEGVKLLYLMPERVIIEKLFQTSAKPDPMHLSVNLLSPMNPAWTPCTSCHGLTALLQQRRVVPLP